MGVSYAERRGALRRKIVYALAVLGPSTASQLTHWMNAHYKPGWSPTELAQIIVRDTELRELIDAEETKGVGHAGNGTHPMQYSIRRRVTT